MHLSETLLFIPYGVTVDEFQHLVYSRPEMTPAERKQAWRELEQKYIPYGDYQCNDYLEKGSYWHQQGHIFKNPFYYIDYTLAQVCSFQFWKKAGEDKAAAWSDYLRLCQAGGNKPFGEPVELANLASPFKKNKLSAWHQMFLQRLKAWFRKQLLLCCP
jgi:oligoendopeptidase F